MMNLGAVIVAASNDMETTSNLLREVGNATHEIFDRAKEQSVLSLRGSALAIAEPFLQRKI
jgi:hypothetical protein